MRLGINAGFAVNRYPLPRQWAKVIGKDLGLRYIQLTVDLINPDLGKSLIDKRINEINECKAEYGIEIDSIMTGAFTRRNLFSHPDEQVREHSVKWFKNIIDIAARVGATNVSSHLGILCYEDLHNPERREFILKETVKSWKCLARYAKKKGLKYLSWEPMSIAREYGETIEETKRIMERLKGSPIPIYLCLDVAHGNYFSGNADDRDYKKWLENFAEVSPLIHVKQSLQDKGGCYPFIDEYNKKGNIQPKEFIEKLKMSNPMPDPLILIELSFREREPTDSLVLEHLKESVNYWKGQVEDNVRLN